MVYSLCLTWLVDNVCRLQFHSNVIDMYVARGSLHWSRAGALDLRYFWDNRRMRRAPEFQNTFLLLLHPLHVRIMVFVTFALVIHSAFANMHTLRCFAIAFFAVGLYFLTEPIQQEISQYVARLHSRTGLLSYYYC